jgi:hypothetical protein
MVKNHRKKSASVVSVNGWARVRTDPPLEGAGFEPSVPRQKDNVFETLPPISDGGDSRAEPCRDGFIARPDVSALLREATKRGCAIDLAGVTYYVGHETVVPADDEKALPRWVEALVAFMQRQLRT